MSYSDKKDPQLMEQQSAVMSYLEDLLNEVPDTIVEDISDNVVKAFPKQVQLTEVVAPIVEKTVTPVVTVDVPVEVVVQEQVQEQVQVEQAPTTQPYPDWVEDDEFQCLMFKVAGISMAVPLNRLNGVIPWDNNLTPMPGHSEAFLGLLRHLDKNVKVMDAAKVILPAQQLQKLDIEDERINKILLMDEGRWGLACDDVGEVITLNKDEVRWRTASGRRPWLAGTIAERLCALLDTEVLAGILREGK